MKILVLPDLFDDYGYRYKDNELTPTVLANIMIHIMNGKKFSRREAIAAAKKFHLSHGGIALHAGYTNAFKRATNDQLRGYMDNILRNCWFLNFLPSPVGMEIEPLIVSKKSTPIKSVNENEADSIVGNGNECVYVYYYDTYKEMATLKGLEKWKCKIGMSTSSPSDRVLSQAGTAMPEKPHIGVIIRTDNAKGLESLIHHYLKFNDAHLEEAPGTEWFVTNPDEILNIYNKLFLN